jgi:hypothetical protein
MDAVILSRFSHWRAQPPCRFFARRLLCGFSSPFNLRLSLDFFGVPRPSVSAPVRRPFPNAVFMRLEIMGAVALIPPHVRRLFRLTGFLWHAASFPLINALFGFFGAFARLSTGPDRFHGAAFPETFEAYRQFARAAALILSGKHIRHRQPFSLFFLPFHALSNKFIKNIHGIYRQIMDEKEYIGDRGADCTKLNSCNIMEKWRKKNGCDSGIYKKSLEFIKGDGYLKYTGAANKWGKKFEK